MGIFAEITRPYSLMGLHSISGKANSDLRNWFEQSCYQVTTNITNESNFVLSIHDARPLMVAFATDTNRMAIAAIESLNEISKETHPPKACAWIIIQSYYAAFYAAHAILRLFGTSCTQLDASLTKVVLREAKIMGNDSVSRIQSGFYECVYDEKKRELKCAKTQTGGGGSHEAMWNAFLRKMIWLDQMVLVAKTSQSAVHSFTGKISDLCENLRRTGCTHGNWLSFIRNSVTYKHEHGVWYPYQKNGAERCVLRSRLLSWEDDPLSIELRSYKEREIERFTHTCLFIVSMWNELAIDLASRCPQGRSFLKYGATAYVNSVGN